MSTYAFMKILESAPGRYDKGIRLLTGGKLGKSYERLVSNIESGDTVLDIGCGTGALSLLAAKRGARVKGIDVNPQMLEIAKQRVVQEKLEQKVELYEAGIAELGNEASASYDVLVSGLCFSELSEDELVYALKEAARLLKPAGLLLIADEVSPDDAVMRILNSFVRIPVKVITYIMTQTTTNAVKQLPEKVQKAGFVIVSTQFNRSHSFIELVAGKGGGPEE